MKLEFLGTRGYIEARSDAHRMHSSLMVSYYGKDVMVDCGEDWLGHLEQLNPRAIVITHAHPDHAFGLRRGAPCPVYATEESWEEIGHYDLEERVVVPKRKPVEIEGITFEAFPVDHSTLAPAVGYRISAGRVTIFYVPDVVWIKDRAGALRGAKVYIGDGATITRSMVRKPGNELIGHVPLRTQLTWCQKEGVPRAIFSHCGSAIVEGDPKEVQATVDELADERGVRAEIAHDGMVTILR
jgi:phosphoribosyl 1,2-cyclic phosphodiesterase